MPFAAPVRSILSGPLMALGIAVSLVGLPASAQIGVSGPSANRPQAVMCTDLQVMKQLPCPDSTLMFYEGEALVQGQLGKKSFAELDRLYTEWCRGVDRFPDGRWKLTAYGNGLQNEFEGWNRWERDLDLIKAWQIKEPSSEAARYVEAVYWRSYAWRARGTGYARSVSSDGWALFQERLAKAQAAIAPLLAQPPRCAAPYSIGISLLIESGASEAQLRKVYDEAVHRFPQYHNLYFSMSRHYDPAWGGSREKYQRFALEAARATRDFEGMGMYARIFWLLDRPDALPFSGESGKVPDWGRLKIGYEDLLRRYPSSLSTIGKYAGVACRSSDGALYRRLRAQIVGYESTAEMVDPIDVCDRRHHWEPPPISQRPR